MRIATLFDAVAHVLREFICHIGPEGMYSVL